MCGASLFSGHVCVLLVALHVLNLICSQSPVVSDYSPVTTSQTKVYTAIPKNSTQKWGARQNANSGKQGGPGNGVGAGLGKNGAPGERPTCKMGPLVEGQKNRPAQKWGCPGTSCAKLGLPKIRGDLVAE